MNTSGTGFLRQHTVRAKSERRATERSINDSMQRLANRVIDGVVKPDADRGHAWREKEKADA